MLAVLKYCTLSDGREFSFRGFAKGRFFLYTGSETGAVTERRADDERAGEHAGA